MSCSPHLPASLDRRKSAGQAPARLQRSDGFLRSLCRSRSLRMFPEETAVPPALEFPGRGGGGYNPLLRAHAACNFAKSTTPDPWKRSLKVNHTPIFKCQRLQRSRSSSLAWTWLGLWLFWSGIRKREGMARLRSVMLLLNDVPRLLPPAIYRLLTLTDR